MIQGTYNFPDIVSGDTSTTTDFQIITNGAPTDLTGCTIKMDFANAAGAVVKYFSTVDSTITFTDIINGKFRVEQYLCDIPKGPYTYDIQIIFADGQIKTYVSGTITVLPQVTL